MSYTIVWCKQPNSNKHWVMECGVKGIYPTKNDAMDAIRKKFNKEVDDELKLSADDWDPNLTEAMIRGMIIDDWMIEESSSSMSWFQYGEPYPVMYKVVKIPRKGKDHEH